MSPTSSTASPGWRHLEREGRGGKGGKGGEGGGGGGGRGKGGSVVYV